MERALGDGEDGGQQRQELGVGGSIDGRRCEGDLGVQTLCAQDSTATSAGLGAD